MLIRTILSDHARRAMQQAGISKDCPAAVKISGNPQFGDYQINGVMGAAKKMKTNPQALAEQVVAYLALDDIAEKVEVAGPGFINIHLKSAWIAEQLNSLSKESNRGAEPVTEPKTIVIDYSGPNLAKEMHVGHLRSTIIRKALWKLWSLRKEVLD